MIPIATIPPTVLERTIKMRIINQNPPSAREIMQAASRLGGHLDGRQVLQNLLPVVDAIGHMQPIDVDDILILIYGANTFDISTPKWIKRAIETEGRIVKS